MDLFHKLNKDENLLNFFCDLLEDLISNSNKIQRGYDDYKVNIEFKKSDMSIFFFIDGSSILQIMPDKDLQYTYANVPSYQNEIRSAISVLETQFNRDERINQIIKKES